MSSVDLALAYFKEGFSCSQSVLLAYAPAFGVDRKTALKVAGAFGGGIGRMGETCGAVSGALMVLGLKYAAVDAKDTQTKEKLYEFTRELVRQFQARNSAHFKCSDLLGCAIVTPEDLQAARDRALFTTLCPKFVRDAAEIAAQLIGD
jgi:C_GCAxxG_C_C family probable redox protein